MTAEFETLVSGTDMTVGKVNEVIESAEEMFPFTRDQYKLTYHLKIRTVPSGGMGPAKKYIQNWQERSAAGRARAFVRAKNPFEPDVVDVDDPVRDAALTSDETGQFYSVDASVIK